MAFTTTNFLDDIALFQNLRRLSGETNEAFTARIKDFASIRFGTDYITQIQSVMLQTGLKKIASLEFECEDPYEIEITEEYITFKSFFSEDDSASVPIYKYADLKKYFRVFLADDPDWRVNLKSMDRSSIPFTLVDIEIKTDFTGNFLLRNSNARVVHDIIDSKRTRLTCGNIIPGSFRCNKVSLCSNRVKSVIDLKKQGDYFLDDIVGYLELFVDSISGSFFIEYKTYDKIFIFYRTQLSLQSIDTFIKYGLNDNFIDMLPQILYNKSVGE